MVKYLLYAPGSRGIGHFRRMRAILKPLLCASDRSLLLTPSDYGYVVKEKLLNVKITKVQNEVEVLSETQKFNPDVLIVDTLPMGVNGELTELIKNKNLKKVLVLRQRHDISLARLRKQISFYDLVLLPYRKGNSLEKLLRGAAPIVSVGEIFNSHDIEPKHTRRKFNVPQKAILIVATCGGGGTIDSDKITPIIFSALKKVSNEIKSYVIFSTGPMNRVKLGYSSKTFKIYKYIPDIQNLIAAANLVICFGGYNTINEVVAASRPAIILPSRTLTDDQVRRAKEAKKFIRSDFIVTKKLSTEKLYLKIKHFLIAMPLVNRKHLPAINNGAKLAAEEIRALAKF